ncbi:hypothetical protein VZT92_006825 [Zoarces viviparus]|uniref:Uncharacterized protein n=1 Tax=Zoarces viviparus TaxID=48416 RepID=A0AAW1FQK0_ZOAVI
MEVRESVNGAQRPCAGALSGSSSNPSDSSSQGADKCNFRVGVEEEVRVLTGQENSGNGAVKSYAPSTITRWFSQLRPRELWVFFTSAA